MQALDEADPKRRRRRRRRRRRGNPDRAGFAALLPSLLTTGNLAAGFLAILKAGNGDVLAASYAIFVAALFDILDGRAARMTGNVSRFGAEYDSIADTVSFGVAPAILAFHAGHIADLRWAGGVMVFVYTACASLRLARFNVQSGRYLYRFDGLPSPAAAGMVVSAVWFKNFWIGPHEELGLPPILPALGVVLLGLLMVSPIPYRSFKDLKLGKGFSGTVIPVIVSMILLVEPELNFFLVGLAYVVSGPAGILWRWRTGRELVPAEAEEAKGSGEGEDEGPGDAAGTRSIWDEFEGGGTHDGREGRSEGAPNVTSIAEHLSAGGGRGGEGIR